MLETIYSQGCFPFHIGSIVPFSETIRPRNCSLCFNLTFGSLFLFQFLIGEETVQAYTITKQWQKWTEEDHQKFLEALKLYGRGWYQIEGKFLRLIY